MASDPTLAIVRIAAQRGGICTRSDLIEAGVSSSAIGRRQRSGALEPICNGVYLLTEMASSSSARWAAVTAVPSAALALDTAGLEYNMALDPTAANSFVHVLSPKGAGRVTLRLPPQARVGHQPTTVIVHESRRREAGDFTTDREGRPITTRARTVLDLAGSVGPKRLAHIVDQQVSTRLLDVGALRAIVESRGGRGVAGTRNLRRLLLERYDRPEIPGSELEVAVMLALHRHGVSGFSSQFRPPWFDGIRGIVDFAHPGARVILEADSRRWHRSQAAMAEDRRRDLIAAARGWIVVRVTWDQVHHRADETFERVGAVLTTRLAA